MKFKVTDVYFECEETNQSDIFRTGLTFYIEEENDYKPSYIDRLNFYQNLETVSKSNHYKTNESIEIMHLNNLSTFNIRIKSYRKIEEDFRFVIKSIVIVLREWLESFSFCKIIRKIQAYINFRLSSNRGYKSEYELNNELTVAKFIVDAASELLTKEERLLLESSSL